MDQATRSRWITGVMLIALGLGLFAMQYVRPLAQSTILMVLGGTFVATYLATRKYVLLVFGGILLGIGAGSFGEREFFVYGEMSKVGLGAGFVLIWLVALLWERRSNWWPLIPGSILILLGLRTWGRVWRFLLSDGWPLILVIVGVLILLGAVGKPKKARSES